MSTCALFRSVNANPPLHHDPHAKRLQYMHLLTFIIAFCKTTYVIMKSSDARIYNASCHMPDLLPGALLRTSPHKRAQHGQAPSHHPQLVNHQQLQQQACQVLGVVTGCESVGMPQPSTICAGGEINDVVVPKS